MTAPTPLQKNNVNIAGKRDAGQAMVFVHGFGTDQGAWHKIVPAFSQTYRIVLLDQIGSGGSQSSAYSICNYLNLKPYADDLTDVLAHLDITNAVLVGHSVGAIVAVLAALQTPQRILKLVLLGANPRYLNEDGYTGGFARQDIDDIYREATQSYPDWLASFASAAMANPDRPELARYFAKCLNSYPPEWLLTVLCSVLQTDYRQEIGQLEIPAQIIQSRNDPFVPLATAEYMQSRIKHSVLQVIDADGHFPHLSAAEQVIAAMRGFLG